MKRCQGSDFGQLLSDTNIMVAVITSIQCERSNTNPKQRLSVVVKLDDDGRVTVWDEEALSQANCQLIKGRLLGRRREVVTSQRKDINITPRGMACRKRWETLADVGHKDSLKSEFSNAF